MNPPHVGAGDDRAGGSAERDDRVSVHVERAVDREGEADVAGVALVVVEARQHSVLAAVVPALGVVVEGHIEVHGDRVADVGGYGGEPAGEAGREQHEGVCGGREDGGNGELWEGSGSLPEPLERAPGLRGGD
ncbi:hypothetical protein CMI37_16060, partial [Candidatus Pacearchaeota archaeon]|nr:hypothetical protein [Candidatus Pacearchaeota archaeon]